MSRSLELGGVDGAYPLLPRALRDQWSPIHTFSLLLFILPIFSISFALCHIHLLHFHSGSCYCGDICYLSLLKTTWSARYSHNINKLHTKCYEIPCVPIIEANYSVMLSHAWSRVDPIYYSSKWIIPVFLIKMQKLYISILRIQNQSGPPFSFLVRFDLKNLLFSCLNQLHWVKSMSEMHRGTEHTMIFRNMFVIFTTLQN